MYQWTCSTSFLFVVSVFLPLTNAASVIIIGGGISGLAAARYLNHYNNVQVTLLEAKDHLGGRLHSVAMHNDTIVDLGGMYWHGMSPVLKELRKIHTIIPSGGTSMHPLRKSSIWLYHNTTQWTQLNKDQIDQVQVLFQNWVTTMKEDYAKNNETCNETSFSQWSNNFLASLERDQREWLSFQLRMNFDFDFGVFIKDMEVHGLENNWNWREHKGQDHIAKYGMGSLIQALEQQLSNCRLLTGQRVNRIQYSSSGCQVSSTTGQSFEADACIVTVPIGVLKELHNELFVPPLSAAKQLALQHTGVGILNTMAVLWKRPICNSSAVYMMAHPRAENPLNTGFVCSGLLRNGNPHLTQFYMSGYHDDANATYWNEKAVEIVQDYVTVTLEDIVDVRRSRWHLDPDYRGSYGAPTHGMSNDDRKIMAEPVDRLFFAGEHTHYNGRFQCIDGAYETGVRAAKDLLRCLGLTRTASIGRFWRNITQSLRKKVIGLHAKVIEMQ